MSFQYIEPSRLIDRRGGADRMDWKVSQWISPWDGKEEMEAGIVGVPLSRSSISPSAASEAPDAIRSSWRSFTPYDADHDVDLSPMRVRDVGNIRMHTTDIPRCHQNILRGMGELYERTAAYPRFLPLIVGGDHSITSPSVQAFARHHAGKAIGLIQFDTHFDVRNLEDGGPSNGTPIRGLLESGVVQGGHVFQIGIHSFANALAYRDYVKEQGITFYTMHQVRQEGLGRILSDVLHTLNRSVDLIYVTVDLDVLDLASLPGSPGPSPGGMVSWELFEAVYRLGKEEKVRALDLVCLDPFRDVGMLSVKTAAHVLLSFLSGYKVRLDGSK
jgi:formiminoglutamase